MKVTRTSKFTGVERTLDLDVTEEGLEQWAQGDLIQNVFPHLTPDEREFIMTGVTGDEWDELFGEPNNESFG